MFSGFCLFKKASFWQSFTTGLQWRLNIESCPCCIVRLTDRSHSHSAACFPRCFSIPGHDITILSREVGHLPGCFTARVHSPVHVNVAALKARVWKHLKDVWFKKKKKKNATAFGDPRAACKPEAKPNHDDTPLLRIPPSVALFGLSTVWQAKRLNKKQSRLKEWQTWQELMGWW